jgi:hypothetical protein
LFGIAHSWTDVNQTTPFGTSTNTTNNSTTISQTVTLTGSNIALGTYYGYSGGTATLTPTDTQIFEAELTSGASGRAAQYGDGTLGWTVSATADNYILVTPLVHDGGAGGTNYTLDTNPAPTATLTPGVVALNVTDTVDRATLAFTGSNVTLTATGVGSYSLVVDSSDITATGQSIPFQLAVPWTI